MSDSPEHPSIRLLGRIAVAAKLRLLSGLSIGGSDPALAASGLDSAIVRDPSTHEPYVPGTSLKGKMRALLERALGLALKEVEGTGDPRRQRFIHLCRDPEEYRGMQVLDGYSGCPVCHLFGTSARGFAALPTRLLTRDAFLDGDSRAALARGSTELPFTEVKTESVVDRISSASTPRFRERVPAGAVFDAGWSIACYAAGGEDRRDHLLLPLFLAGLQLLEDDYLGGQGTRGYGRVAFEGLRIEPARGGALSGEAMELIEKLKDAGAPAAALEAAGNPLDGK